MSLQEEILAFWFGDLKGPHDLGANQKMWWVKDPELDTKIRDRFGADVERAIAGDYDDWLDSPRTALALVILLDQFTRNIFRGSPKTWEHDGKARAVMLDAIERGHLAELRTVEKQFLLLPYMHSEDEKLHEQGMVLITEVLDAVDEEHRAGFDGWQSSAVRHAEIVKRFGRYPHRNEILGRESTEEEIAFLNEPNSSF